MYCNTCSFIKYYNIILPGTLQRKDLWKIPTSSEVQQKLSLYTTAFSRLFNPVTKILLIQFPCNHSFLRDQANTKMQMQECGAF